MASSEVPHAQPPTVISSTRQCVCGGWTRYVVCQYCGTTDPSIAASGMVSTAPLVQLTPEEAAAHPPVPVQATASPQTAAYSGAQVAADAPIPAFAAAAFPPTTFAEAQFGEAPSPASAYSSTAAFAAPARAAASGNGHSSAFAPAEPAAPMAGTPTQPSPFSDAPAAFAGPAAPTAPADAAATPVADAPVPYTDPIPGWSSEPIPASAPPVTPPTSAFTDPPVGFVSPPIAPVSEPPAAAVAGFAGQGEPTRAADVPGVSPAAPAETAPGGQGEQPAVARRNLPRWALPAGVAAAVALAVVAYLGLKGGDTNTADNTAPVVHHVRAPRAANPAGPAAPGVSTKTVAETVPAGLSASGGPTTLTSANLSSEDPVHSPAELSAAGVTGGTSQHYVGSGDTKVVVLTETAASPAQAQELAVHAHHIGYTVQFARGATVICLHAPKKDDAYIALLGGWKAALQ